MANVNGKASDKPAQGGIKIPEFNEDRPISRQEVLGKNADPAQPQPQSEGGDQSNDFLDMVRQSNERKGESTQGETPRNSRQVPTSGADSSESDTESTGSTDGEESEDSSADESFSDPLQNPNLKKSKKSKEENVKALRESRNYHKTEREKLELQLAEANSKIAALSQIQVQAEETERLRARVTELEPLESIIDVFKNPEFRARYVDGLQAQVAQAKAVAVSYNVQDPDTFIAEAMQIGNRADLNRYLGRKLDQFGVADIRDYILSAQQLSAERAEVEKQPQLYKDQLIEMSRDNEKKRREIAVSKGGGRAIDAFARSLALYTTGPYPITQFKDKPGDAEHARVKNQILDRAGDELGKFVGALFRHDLGDLPESMAQTLAARFQLSELSGHLVEENRALMREVSELRQTLTEVQGFSRPDFNTTPGAKPSKFEPKTTDEIAHHVFEVAGQKLASSQRS